MERLSIQRREVPREELTARDERNNRLGRGPKPHHWSRVIAHDVAIYEGDELKVVYIHRAVGGLEPLRAALAELDFRRDNRTDGLISTSRTFGSLPRVPLRRDYCRLGAINHEHRSTAALLHRLALDCSRLYQKHHPSLFALHAEDAKRALPEWLIGGTPFTSGIVNKDNPLAYHRDAGNFPSRWSAMVVLKRGVQGGELVLPEYDVALECGDGSALLFDGQGLWHGVTPIRCLHAGAHRFSVVFYSLAGVWKCLPPTEELNRIRRLRTERELRRHRGQT